MLQYYSRGKIETLDPCVNVHFVTLCASGQILRVLEYVVSSIQMKKLYDNISYA